MLLADTMRRYPFYEYPNSEVTLYGIGPVTYGQIPNGTVTPKTKKSWGDRLKLGKLVGKDKNKIEESPQKLIPASPRYGYGSVNPLSNLAKSMRYADNWVQGSVVVRPQIEPTRRPPIPSVYGYIHNNARRVQSDIYAHIQPGTLLYPWETYSTIPESLYEEVIPGLRQCHCDENLIGTHRTKQSKSCKKCGGKRSQTVRSKNKNRGKLDPSQFNDPYEYVRQTRLANGVLSKSAADLVTPYEEYDMRKEVFLNDRMRHNAAAVTRLESAVYTEECLIPRKLTIHDTFSGRLKLINNLNLVKKSGGKKEEIKSDTLSSRLSFSDVNLSDTARLEALEKRKIKNRKSILECNVTAYDLLAKHTYKAAVPKGKDTSGESSDELSDSVFETEGRTVVNTTYEHTTIRVTGERIKIFTPGQQTLQVSEVKPQDDNISSLTSCDLNSVETDSQSTLSLSDQVSMSSNETVKLHTIPPPPQVPPPPPPPAPIRPPRKGRLGREDGEPEDRGHGLLPCVTPAELLHVKSILKKAPSTTDTSSETDSELYSPAFREFRQRKKKVHFRSNHDITLLEVDDNKDISISCSSPTPTHVNTIRVNTCVPQAQDHTPLLTASRLEANISTNTNSFQDHQTRFENSRLTAASKQKSEEICRTGVRRSLSERLPQPKTPVFNDTMRLKTHNRGALFSSGQAAVQSKSFKGVPRFLSPPRPTVPPPPPPKRHSICTMPLTGLNHPSSLSVGDVNTSASDEDVSLNPSKICPILHPIGSISTVEGDQLLSKSLSDICLSEQRDSKQNKKMITFINVGSSSNDCLSSSVQMTVCDEVKCDISVSDSPVINQQITRTTEPASCDYSPSLPTIHDELESDYIPTSDNNDPSDPKNGPRPTGALPQPLKPMSDSSGTSDTLTESLLHNMPCLEEPNVPKSLSCARSRFCLSMLDADLPKHKEDTEQDQYEEMDVLYEQIREHIYEELDPKISKSAQKSKGHLRSRSLPPKSKSMFEGASKYDILSYLEGVRERGLSLEELDLSSIVDGEDGSPCTSLDKRNSQNRISNISSVSDSSDETTPSIHQDFLSKERRSTVEVERNDSGVGSETSKPVCLRRSSTEDNLDDPLCEDCDQPYDIPIHESLASDDNVACQKCSKKRQERKEIITEIIETEIKYGRDLRIIQGEFHRPMLVAGLLTPEQLEAIFLNIDELIDINSKFTEKLKDALEIALEQGDEDLSTVNIGQLFLNESNAMLRAFEGYCVRQGSASVLLANLEKEKELLRVFLRVSQMENTLLRRMNLSSFLMVPVQRVTKYPLLLGRLFKVTPHHHSNREAVKLAQRKIELHLEHMNAETKDLTTTKLWRRISIINNPSYKKSLSEPCEQDMGNIKLRKMAMDALQWSSEEVRFVMEGKLSFTQSSDNIFTLQRRSKAWRFTIVSAILVTFGKPSNFYRPDLAEDSLFFPQNSGIKEATLVLVKDKNGKFSLVRDPLSLDKCIVCSDPEIEDCFEIHEIQSKESYIFKSDDPKQTQMWYHQVRYHSQGNGFWRKRRPALANIMINGMSRS